MKTVQYGQGNTLVGFISGVFGGIGSFMLDIQIGFMSDMMIAILTACLCGAAGVAGKEAYQFVKRKVFKRKKI